MEIWEGALAYVQIMSAGEFVAVILALVYVILAARENRWCWPAGILSSILFAVLFFDNSLKFDMLLNAYYVLIGFYGWVNWSRSVDSDTSQKLNPPPIRKLRRMEWFYILPALILCGALGWIAENYWQSGFWQTDFPYLDAFTTVFAVWTTWMVTVRVLENWLFWVVIDAASIYLYIEKELYFTALLFALYVLIAIVGFYQWNKSYAKQA